MDDTFPIRALNKPLPILGCVVLSLALAIWIDAKIYPDHGRVVFFSAIMSCFALYSGLDMLKRASIVIFVIIYVGLHVALCFMGALADDAYYGAVLLPAALLDYAVYVYVLYFLYRRPA
ncbi:MAG TPA: hypothetical protein VIC34_06745 [Croceibacterium sp.]|jgi:hypothetical protein